MYSWGSWIDAEARYWYVLAHVETNRNHLRRDGGADHDIAHERRVRGWAECAESDGARRSWDDERDPDDGGHFGDEQFSAGHLRHEEAGAVYGVSVGRRISEGGSGVHRWKRG